MGAPRDTRPQRRRHHKAEQSAEAQRLIDEGLARGATYDVIAQECAAVGVEISASAIGRYHAAKWRPAQRAISQAQQIAEQLFAKMGALDDAELARAMRLQTAQMLFPMLATLAEEKPGALATFAANLEYARVEEAKVAAKRAEIDMRLQALELAKTVAERKLALARTAAEKALAKGGDKPRTKAELQAAIKQLYGIVSEPTAPALTEGFFRREEGAASSPRAGGATGGRIGRAPTTMEVQSVFGTARASVDSLATGGLTPASDVAPGGADDRTDTLPGPGAGDGRATRPSSAQGDDECRSRGGRS